MYIAVCDDQAEELEALTNLLHIWQEEHKTALRYKTFRSAAQLLDAAEKERFTLYLLDVMMPGMNGLAAAREIRGFDGENEWLEKRAAAARVARDTLRAAGQDRLAQRAAGTTHANVMPRGARRHLSPSEV